MVFMQATLTNSRLRRLQREGHGSQMATRQIGL
jgi:hypothetical protein